MQCPSSLVYINHYSLLFLSLTGISFTVFFSPFIVCVISFYVKVQKLAIIDTANTSKDAIADTQHSYMRYMFRALY